MIKEDNIISRLRINQGKIPLLEVMDIQKEGKVIDTQMRNLKVCWVITNNKNC